MKNYLSALLLSLLPVLLQANEGGAHIQRANIDVSNQASLQNGAKLFVNYCLSCHSAAYMRYSRMAQDLGLTTSQVEQNLMFTTDKIGGTMTVAMTSDDAKAWFGTAVPDLSVIARVRGADWLYSYLTSFYLDDSRPTGVNNLVFPDVGMPDVLGNLQGWKKPIFKHDSEHGGADEIDHLEMVETGTMSEPEFNKAARDLTAYLVYMGEPIQLYRKHLGIWVILFLIVFTLVGYALKKEYWKDVH